MVELYPHQKDAVEKLDSGSILCGGTGTGKSIVSLYYFFEKECGSFRKKDLFIITTARKRDTDEWEGEMRRFGSLAWGMNYTIDSWNNIHKYEQVEGAFFIFDEQRVVGSGAWVKSFLKITKANRWILLSATPGDTWLDYAPVFIANGFYRNRTEFLRRHAVYNRYSKYPKIDKWLEVGYLEMLRRKITVTMKFEKSTVPHNITLTATYDQEKYNDILKNRWDPYRLAPIRDISGVCYLLRRVINEDESRLERVKEIMAEHKKVVVFYNFDYELDILLTLQKIRKVAQWNGHIHEAIPNTDEWVYLVQYTAGCEGWNCTETDTIIFYSRSYSYKQMTQAAGRIDRLNTPFRDLYYYTLESNASIDRAISRALMGKRNFNEKIFAAQENLA